MAKNPMKLRGGNTNVYGNDTHHKTPVDIAARASMGPNRGGHSSVVVDGGKALTRGGGIVGGPQTQYRRNADPKGAFPMTDRPVAHRNIHRGR